MYVFKVFQGQVVGVGYFSLLFVLNLNSSISEF